MKTSVEGLAQSTCLITKCITTIIIIILALKKIVDKEMHVVCLCLSPTYTG